MGNIELVLTDFDGTVVELGKHIVSDNVRQAVIACEEKGVQVIPVTGRSHHFALPILEVLGFDGLGVFDNGASIRQVMTGELVWSCWLSSELVKKAASVLAPLAQVIHYVTTDEWEHIPADNELGLIDATSHSNPDVFAIVGHDEVATATSQLSQISGITFYTAASMRPDIEGVGFQVTATGADKFHGVEALRTMLAIAKERTLAIGDGDNDVELFKNAGFNVAMGNASERLKSLADAVVGSVTEDGFVEAMNRFVLS